MIDYVKIHQKSKQWAERLGRNPKIELSSTISKDGEVMSQQAKLGDLEIFIRADEVTVAGSLHKFWSNANENHSDFSYWALCQAIGDSSEILEFDPKEAKILGLEYGVNVTTTIPPKEIISKAVCYDWREPFESMKGIVGIGYGTQANLSNYRVKLYDKGTPNGKENLLRFESKTLRSCDLDGLGANFLYDLTKQEVLSALGERLIERFNDVLILGDWCIEEDDKDKLRYAQYQNPKYWRNLSRAQRYNERAKFLKMCNKYAKENLHKPIAEAIADKWRQLQSCDVFAWFTDKIAFAGYDVLDWYSATEGEAKEGAVCDILSLLKARNVANTKTCLVTGEPINSKNRRAKFLGAADLRQSPEVLEKVAKVKKRKKYKRESSNDDAYFVAHNVRNDYFNKANNARRSIVTRQKKEAVQPTLFPMVEQLGKTVLESVERFAKTKYDPFYSCTR